MTTSFIAELLPALWGATRIVRQSARKAGIALTVIAALLQCSCSEGKMISGCELIQLIESDYRNSASAWYLTGVRQEYYVVERRVPLQKTKFRVDRATVEIVLDSSKGKLPAVLATKYLKLKGTDCVSRR